jgi:chromosomal replication initiator protein
MESEGSVDNRKRRLIEIAVGPLIPRYTYETFIVGESNTQAYWAARKFNATSDNILRLFFYGDSGLGKTHLIHAMWHSILAKNADVITAYLPGRIFSASHLSETNIETLQRFRKQLYRADLIIIDDLQFLAGKIRNAEIMSLFDLLPETRKPLVIS